ncbi:MAG: DUF169 domain-containing protein [Candidatus Sulfotelmatobacter sp.]|jgi:uncharacterized protein (DUF169 family)
MTRDLLDKWDRQLYELTKTRAVAVAFSDVRPTQLLRKVSPQPSGCSFWKLAAEGSVFYADAPDHYGCLVGAYALGAELSQSQTAELVELTSAMVKLSYVKAQEVAELPHRSDRLRFVIYGPLKLSPSLPDLVLVRGNVRQLMLLTEAARAAGFLKSAPAMGRPACAIIPESLASGQAVLSLACIGNRVYTGLGDHEGYCAIPGKAIESVCACLSTVLEANEILGQFHREKQGQLSRQLNC